MIINKKRWTAQKVVVMDFLKSVKTHPTAEMVFNEVKAKLPNITLATVYRNLNSLAEDGAILRLEINKEYHYDADTSYHQHCVCKKCGKISDVFQKEITKYALKKLEAEFYPESVNIVYFGTCKECYRRTKNDKQKSTKL
ncbi:transcriptional repressor [Candidatus Woesearchaeota archaeon]|nr:MAG: transcriptional repressor [Candidatus Woesearchaeota archaeon]